MLKDIVNSGLQPVLKAREVSAKPTETEPEEVKSSVQPTKDAEEPKQQELQSAVKKLNDYVQNIQRTLSFSVEENTGTTVVRVFDSETEELIRQIPAEETIKLAASIEAHTANLLFKEQA